MIVSDIVYVEKVITSTSVVAFRLTCKSMSFIPRKVKDSSLNLALCFIM